MRVLDVHARLVEFKIINLEATIAEVDHILQIGPLRGHGMTVAGARSTLWKLNGSTKPAYGRRRRP